MDSSKPNRKAWAADDVGLSIERWQADNVARKDHEAGTGLIASLFSSLIEVVGLVLLDMKTRPDTSRHYQSLESSSAALFFWGTDFGVSQGELDEELQDSVQLRDTCLLVLVSIAQFIVYPFARLLSSKDRHEHILNSTDIRSSLKQAMNILGQHEYGPGYQPEQTKKELCHTLGTKIDTLIRLGPSLASPAEEEFDGEEPRVIEDVEEPLPEQAYISSVAHKFPLAASTIVIHLGKLNWARYNHMLQLQRNASQHGLEMTSMDKAKSVFQDSALGTSVPAQSEIGFSAGRASYDSQSVYAPSMVSSRAEASHRRLPPLSLQARSGVPFTCAICNRKVRYQRTKAWKKHIFDDILAYTCLFAECSVADVFFEDCDAMMIHLEYCHGLDVSVSEVTCPLCLEYVTSSRDALSLHLARHMEETALAILPSGVDFGEEPGSDTMTELDSLFGDRPSLDSNAATDGVNENDTEFNLAKVDDDANSYRAVEKRRRSSAHVYIKLPPHAVNHLRAWLRAHRDDPYPNHETKHSLAKECGITEKQVTTWFTNSRARKMTPSAEASRHSSEDKYADESDFSSVDITMQTLGSRIKKDYRRTNTVSPIDDSPVLRKPVTLSPGLDSHEKPRWPCTFCPQHLPPKSWRRHEETQHRIKSQWTCLATSPRMTMSSHTESYTICAFCQTKNPSDDHFLYSHRITECSNKCEADRTFSRLDHLRQHVKNFHKTSLLDMVSEKWRRDGPDVNVNESWTCGFCAAELKTWSIRETHISNHFKEGLTMKDWLGQTESTAPDMANNRRRASREESRTMLQSLTQTGTRRLSHKPKVQQLPHNHVPITYDSFMSSSTSSNVPIAPMLTDSTGMEFDHDNLLNEFDYPGPSNVGDFTTMYPTHNDLYDHYLADDAMNAMNDWIWQLESPAPDMANNGRRVSREEPAIMSQAPELDADAQPPPKPQTGDPAAQAACEQDDYENIDGGPEYKSAFGATQRVGGGEVQQENWKDGA